MLICIITYQYGYGYTDLYSMMFLPFPSLPFAEIQLERQRMGGEKDEKSVPKNTCRIWNSDIPGEDFSSAPGSDSSDRSNPDISGEVIVKLFQFAQI